MPDVGTSRSVVYRPWARRTAALLAAVTAALYASDAALAYANLPDFTTRAPAILREHLGVASAVRNDGALDMSVTLPALAAGYSLLLAVVVVLNTPRSGLGLVVASGVAVGGTAVGLLYWGRPAFGGVAAMIMAALGPRSPDDPYLPWAWPPAYRTANSIMAVVAVTVLLAALALIWVPGARTPKPSPTMTSTSGRPLRRRAGNRLQHGILGWQEPDGRR